MHAEVDNEEIIDRGVILYDVPEEPPPSDNFYSAMDVPGVAAPDGYQWNQWNWDRAAEELAWEKLLGLDGSVVFL